MRSVLQPGRSAATPPASRRRRALRVLSTLLLVTGVLVVTDAVLTVTWQEPLTSAVAALRQGQLSGQLDELRDQGPTALERRALARIAADAAATAASRRESAAKADADVQARRLAFLARSLRRRTAAGGALGRIRIPAIGLSRVVVDGSGGSDLRRGPGFYDDTPLPGVPGTTAIAGHRTTYGAPFRHLDEVDPGDTIRVEMPYATFTYRVESRRIVKATALWVIKRVKEDRLVLSACHPLFSAKQRIVVFAKLVRTDARTGSAWTGVRADASQVQGTKGGSDA